MNNINYFRLFAFYYLTTQFILFWAQPLFSQSVNYSLTPSVFYFDCDHSAAIGDSTVLDSTSQYIYRAIMQNSLTEHTLFIARERLDTAAETGSFTAPTDTLVQTGADYLIGSTLTGNPGSYSLTIYIEDGYSRAKFASGTANFSSATYSEIQNACNSATSQILPLINKIQNYQKQLRANDPTLSIDPKIIVQAAKTQLNYGETTNVTITVIDYDGLPLANRHITLSSNGGSFSPNNAITNGNGQATVTFTAGNSDFIADLSASISDEKLTTHNSTDVDGDEMILVGFPETSEVWQLFFTYKIEKVGFEDDYSFIGPNESWTQSSNTSTRTIGGLITGWGILVQNNFIFTASNDTSSGAGVPESGFALGKYFAHDFSHGNSHDYFHGCYGISMMGSTENGSIPPPFKLMSASMQLDDSDTNFTLSANFNKTHFYQEMDRGWGSVDMCNENKDTLFYSLDSNLIDFYTSTKNPNTSITFDGKEFFINFSSVTVQNSSSLTSSNNRYAKYEIIDSSFSGVLKPFPEPTSVKDNKMSTPLVFSLSQNYPNPFNPSTTIEYQIPKSSHVILKVFDVLGNQVAQLVDKNETAGKYSVRFNSSKLSSGVYFYRIDAGDFVQTKKLIVLK